MVLIYIFCIIVVFSAASVTYVYSYRGQARYVDAVEYFRKGWPIFAPLNCLLYMFTQKKARTAILDVNQFEELKVVSDQWQTIREEAIELHKNKFLENTGKVGSVASYDLGFRTFYKYGWSKFYLTWYGHTHKSAQNLCPKTLEILKKSPLIKGAMFSVLPPGAKLTRHLDPVACSLRYHLGLKTPNDDKCFINVDENNYSWRDGEGFIFDETYLHYATNNSQEDRLILMCDIARPMNFIGKVINFFYGFFMKLSVVPNMEGDKRGFINLVFSSVSPFLKRSKKLKSSRPKLYVVLKFMFNSLLILLLLGLILSFVKFVIFLVNWI